MKQMYTNKILDAKNTLAEEKAKAKLEIENQRKEEVDQLKLAKTDEEI